MANIEALNEIQNKARLIRTSYPKVAADFQRERENVQIARQHNESWLDTARHGRDAWEAVGRQYEQDIYSLNLLLAEHMPEVAKQHPAIAPNRWYERPEEEWGELLTSLHDVEVDAKNAILTSKRPPAATTSTGASRDSSRGDEADIHQLAAAVGDDHTVEILRIAEQDNLSAGEKMSRILRIDPRWLGKTSEQWASLLKVKSPAIRQTDTWINRPK